MRNFKRNNNNIKMNKKIINKNIMSKRDEATVILMRCDKRHLIWKELIRMEGELTKLDKKDIKKVSNYMKTGEINGSTKKTVDEVIEKIENDFSDELNKIFFNSKKSKGGKNQPFKIEILKEIL